GGVDSDLGEDRPAVDIQMVEGIPDPGHLEVFIEHHDQVTDVIGGRATDVDLALRQGEDDRVPVGQTLHFVVEAVTDLVPQGRQLRIDRREVRLTHGVAGQVHLPQDVLVIPDRVAVAARADHRSPRQQVPAASGVDPQTRLVVVEIPFHATREVGGDRVRDAVAGQGGSDE